MKKSHLFVAVICSLSLLLLSGCYKDGDGKLELKEPKKELSEMPPGIRWTINGPVDETGNPIELEKLK
ncbi:MULTISPECIES: hypothetical protein [Nitrosomonas]|uniref:Uncharacterized protein n=1 Tax=Nitrosomonas oligotropha TaxID=42354 RepID=A0A1H8T7U5_9PROT|nr:hypothetical protein [Nitrosomonas oligotropha]SDX22295.1 hypothetical protein SAMN05216300_12334 [Nitrosomonas oligotropha]SEO86644.1 hypothetical protein SAMN05216333_12234 [Nitrosomonas oligotropha]